VIADIAKIADKIRKLLDLSKSANQHEAASAAVRAAALMSEYELTEAEVRLTDDRAAENIDRRHFLFEDDGQRRRRCAWQEAISSALARSLGCKDYYWNSQPVVLGRESACQTWRYTCHYLFREVDRLCEEAWAWEAEEAQAAGQHGKAWKNAFRMGAATEIAIRLREETQRVQKTRDMDLPLRPERHHALILLRRDHEEVESAYKQISKKFKTMASIGSIRSRTGYEAGQEAGKGLSLGGSRAGLGAPAKRIAE
jgi:hypothetical protein